MWLNKYKLFNAYNLVDVINLISEQEINEFNFVLSESFINLIVSAFNYNSSSISPQLNNLNIVSWNSSSSVWELKENVDKVLNLIFNRFKFSYCVSIIESASEEEKIFEAKKFLNNFLNILDMTSPYYLTLLNAYKSKENNLLDGLTTEANSLARFNDTPQNEGDFANDSHTSSTNEVKASTTADNKDVIEKLKSLKDSYNNLLLEWSNEFERLFTLEVAL